MRTPEQVVWDFVQQWLDRAEKDLRAAGVLLESGIEDYENVGFHAQQAAEKFIKALLVCHQIEFPKTHDISRLRDLVAQVDEGLAGRLELADPLTPYGVEFRYPGDLDKVSREQGKEALGLAEQVKVAVHVTLRSYLEAGRPGDDHSRDGLDQDQIS